MPGIVGIVSNTSRDRNENDLHLMLRSMMHYQFYASGTYVNEQIGFYIGWVNHKNSFSD